MTAVTGLSVFLEILGQLFEKEKRQKKSVFDESNQVIIYRVLKILSASQLHRISSSVAELPYGHGVMGVVPLPTQLALKCNFEYSSALRIHGNDNGDANFLS